MHHLKTLVVLSACCLCALTLAIPAQAQGDGASNRFALALGAGVVEPDGQGELYYTGALRFRIGRDEHRQQGDDWRYANRGDVRAYIEPEVGYWSRDDQGTSESDLSVGVNGIGVVPGRIVDYFFGVGLGVHSIDTKIEAGGVTTFDESDTKFGGNFQVGLDIHMTDSVSLFGTGRFDIIEGLDDTLQGKVYAGLRFRF
jgi:hypothetical protein